jgi:hypothetical protein
MLDASHRGMVAAALETLRWGDNQHKVGDADLRLLPRVTANIAPITRAAAAALLNVSERTVAAAAKIRRLIRLADFGVALRGRARGAALAEDSSKELSSGCPSRARARRSPALRTPWQHFHFSARISHESWRHVARLFSLLCKPSSMVISGNIRNINGMNGAARED